MVHIFLLVTHTHQTFMVGVSYTYLSLTGLLPPHDCGQSAVGGSFSTQSPPLSTQSPPLTLSLPPLQLRIWTGTLREQVETVTNTVCTLERINGVCVCVGGGVKGQRWKNIRRKVLCAFRTLRTLALRLLSLLARL